MPSKTCIILAGPTASGKTDLSIEIATAFNTEIISADSRQCYREMRIGVARPEEEQLLKIPHHFIASIPIEQHFTAADFEKFSLNKVQEIFGKKVVAVMVGGTGLYIKAFSEGLDDIPATSPQIRDKVEAFYNLHGIEWLTAELQTCDPLFASSGEMKNPRRMMRALEVFLTTGKSILEFQQHQKQKRDFNILKICLDIPRNILYERINLRVDQMMQNGLLEEVRALISYKSYNALQTVGYRELFDYLEGRISLDEAVNLIKQNTRHYAKRQITWFKKDPEFIWLKPEAVLDFLKGIK